MSKVVGQQHPGSEHNMDPILRSQLTNPVDNKFMHVDNLARPGLLTGMAARVPEEIASQRGT